MKKHILLGVLFISISTTAQVLINGNNSATTTNMSSPSVLLEFQSNVNKGIILPWTNGEVASPANGTFILDSSTRKVKVYSNGGWRDLSNNAKTINPIDVSLQSAPENTAAKVVVGNKNTAPNGIYVLESTDKAFVLPKVASPDTKIINPAPGMMVFDPVKELLCVYNGTEWSYWKAADL